MKTILYNSVMETLTPFYRSPYCDIYYNHELSAVQIVWKGVHIDGGEFRVIHAKIIDVLKRTHSNIIIADTRQMKMIWKEDREWIIQEWYPNAIKAGFRCHALIVMEDSYNKLASKTIVAKYDAVIIDTGYFISLRDAKSWVKKKLSEILISRINSVRKN